jgi:hypothetical protein
MSTEAYYVSVTFTVQAPSAKFAEDTVSMYLDTASTLVPAYDDITACDIDAVNRVADMWQDTDDIDVDMFPL